MLYTTAFLSLLFVYQLIMHFKVRSKIAIQLRVKEKVGRTETAHWYTHTTACKTASGKRSGCTSQRAQLGALGWPRAGGRLKRARTCVSVELIPRVVQQELSQRCKAIILQLKKLKSNMLFTSLGKPPFRFVYFDTDFFLAVLGLCHCADFPLAAAIRDCSLVEGLSFWVQWALLRSAGSGALRLP